MREAAERKATEQRAVDAKAAVEHLTLTLTLALNLTLTLTLTLTLALALTLTRCASPPHGRCLRAPRRPRTAGPT